MRRYLGSVGLVASLVAGCAPSVNMEQERAALLAADREWSQSVKDSDKFTSYFAPDATMRPPGMPAATGIAAIKAGFAQAAATPGFSLTWTAAKADVATSGEVGYTTGTYKATMGGSAEDGTYVTVWKRQPDRSWKVSEDIATPSAYPQAPASQHVMVAPSDIKWSDAPPVLPPGARAAVIAGDPTKPQPFVLRLQMPAGYRVAPHWHPADENVTIVSGTLAVGMGDAFNEASMTTLAAGGYVGLPREMRHYVVARTPTILEIHSMGPFAMTYVNAADDPSKKTTQ
jgi:ketosteroid isomerase-like protein